MRFRYTIPPSARNTLRVSFDERRAERFIVLRKREKRLRAAVNAERWKP